jgi:hypothetical protein
MLHRSRAFTHLLEQWLLAPKGSGIMFVSNATQPLLQSALFDEGYAPYTGATGTRPSHTIAGLVCAPCFDDVDRN